MNSKITRRTRHTRISHIDILSGFDSAYTLMYQIGSGLGCTIRQLLSLTVDQVKNRDCLEAYVGPLQIRRCWHIPADVREDIKMYTEGRTGTDSLFILQDGSRLTAGQVSNTFDSFGLMDGSFLPITMRRYYDVTGDIAYPAHMLQTSKSEALQLIQACETAKEPSPERYLSV